MGVGVLVGFSSVPGFEEVGSALSGLAFFLFPNA
jgi:hypothetical protein